MNKIEELLTITMEECGEVTQACSKIMRFGQSQKNLDSLEDEIGDMLCMIDLLHEYDLIRWRAIEERAGIKREKLKKYSSLINQPNHELEFD